jgi:hypothetical protein
MQILYENERDCRLVHGKLAKRAENKLLTGDCTEEFCVYVQESMEVDGTPSRKRGRVSKAAPPSKKIKLGTRRLTKDIKKVLNDKDLYEKQNTPGTIKYWKILVLIKVVLFECGFCSSFIQIPYFLLLVYCISKFGSTTGCIILTDHDLKVYVNITYSVILPDVISF